MTETEKKQAPRKEVTLKKDIIQAGEEKPAGSKVMLREDQIERLKKSGSL